MGKATPKHFWLTHRSERASPTGNFLALQMITSRQVIDDRQAGNVPSAS